MKLQAFVVLFFLLLSIVLPRIIADLRSDKKALLDFAAAVPHGRKLNWSNSSRVCSSWVGITCTTNGFRVSSLRLPGIGLYGPIPVDTIGRMDALTILSLRSNRLSGSLPADILSLPSLRTIYLQQNKFSGNIPSSLSPNLEFIDLSFNSFTGNIPTTIQNLTYLTGLNLQNNSLTGSIPAVKPIRLKQLNLSNNQLNGSVPSSLQDFPASTFEGNSLLCGSPLNPCPDSITPLPSPSPNFFPPSPSPTYMTAPPASPKKPELTVPPASPKNPELTAPPTFPQKPTSKKSLSTGAVIGIAVGASAVSFLLVTTILLCCLKKKKGQEGNNISKGKALVGARGKKPMEEFGSGVQEADKNKLVFFGGCYHNFDLEDLLRASAEVLGKGSYGTTYKAILDDGKTVVVKRLKDVVVGRREFEQQMEIVGTVGEHKNVVPFRAYYYSKDEKLLVYDYIPVGSLSTRLHGNEEYRITLDWVTRVKISLGIAKGLAHIHSAGRGKLIHGNIKSSNILLTQDLHGCISDSGLTPLMGFPIISSKNEGYRAPEVIETKKSTQKSDVYSFGVLLLEMLTGKSPVQSSGHDDVVDLPRWVQSVVREEWTAEVFDVELIKYQDIEEEMVQMLQIAMACVATVPDMRPNMHQIVGMIEKIQLSDTQSRLSSEENNSKSPTTPTTP